MGVGMIVTESWSTAIMVVCSKWAVRQPGGVSSPARQRDGCQCENKGSSGLEAMATQYR